MLTDCNGMDDIDECKFILVPFKMDNVNITRNGTHLAQPWSCKFCGKSYKMLKRVEYHRLSCKAQPGYDGGKIRCLGCSEKFSFEEHLTRHHNSRHTKCPLGVHFKKTRSGVMYDTVKKKF